jgi:acyl carrier protein phosphodiesterase
MMDTVFRVEALRTTLPHAADIQAHFAATYLTHTPAAYGAFWTHIIVPAWNQHAVAYQVALASVAR